VHAVRALLPLNVTTGDAIATSPDESTVDALLRNDMLNSVNSLTQFTSRGSSDQLATALQIVRDALQRWRESVPDGGMSAAHLQKCIQELGPGQCLPVHLHAHNAAVLIEAECTTWRVSALQLALPAADVTLQHEHCTVQFPTASVMVQDPAALLLSLPFAEKPCSWMAMCCPLQWCPHPCRVALLFKMWRTRGR